MSKEIITRDADKYKEYNGIYYNKDTSDEIIGILETCRINNTRIILDYGDTKTGRSWKEKFDLCPHYLFANPQPHRGDENKANPAGDKIAQRIRHFS